MNQDNNNIILPFWEKLKMYLKIYKKIYLDKDQVTRNCLQSKVLFNKEILNLLEYEKNILQLEVT
jgi:hypothetical protein